MVIPFDDDDDAVRIANNSIYGLSGSVFGSQDRALAVARRIRTGTLSINGVTTSRRTRPSGLQAVRRGSRNGVAGLEEFLERKTLAMPVAGVVG
ncbi:aldehyde dehydrogenase family protein [Mycobacterium xenopi 4042]|uniref:Aldehyde dehydrogenase family protein n=1 Tax=Mycobacterium xenopi 4042 TaxID=1299334 RepID=X8AEL3_MYCXE|nr:aldehyde dehydrogenase family protein [Mycobacterium xenopi 4042]